jgi:hypothetical protein
MSPYSDNPAFVLAVLALAVALIAACWRWL